jgi:hypothetical protein
VFLTTALENQGAMIWCKLDSWACDHT